MDVKSIKIQFAYLSAYNINGETGVLECSIHPGMFVDTVIYYNKERTIDLRYYVRWSGMDTYQWTENIERVIIHNNKNREVYFNNKVIGAGETVVIDRKDVDKKYLI